MSIIFNSGVEKVMEHLNKGKEMIRDAMEPRLANIEIDPDGLR